MESKNSWRKDSRNSENPEERVFERMRKESCKDDQNANTQNMVPRDQES